MIEEKVNHGKQCVDYYRDGLVCVCHVCRAAPTDMCTP